MRKPPPDSVHPLSAAEWRLWLKKNHKSASGVWLINYKTETGKPRMDYNTQVEEALCYGWIDSKPAKLDAERSMLWFAPRKAGSAWSKHNKDRVERLLSARRMARAGRAKLEAAKKDGSWNALDEIETVPSDLAAMFAQYSGSEANFANFPPSVKRSILEWISHARRPETRAKRVEETARLAVENVRANQWRDKRKLKLH